MVGLIAFAGFLAAGTAHADDGAALFKANCAKCHGDTGHADSAAAKALKAPALAGNAEIAGLADADLVAKIKANKKHGSLKLTDAGLTDVAAYVKGLK